MRAPTGARFSEQEIETQERSACMQSKGRSPPTQAAGRTADPSAVPFPSPPVGVDSGRPVCDDPSGREDLRGTPLGPHLGTFTRRHAPVGAPPLDDREESRGADPGPVSTPRREQEAAPGRRNPQGRCPSKSPNTRKTGRGARPSNERFPGVKATGRPPGRSVNA